MKQKLPEKKFSYKKSYLSQMQEPQNFSNSGINLSLIQLLITKFFNVKKSINSFDFQIVTLSKNSHNLIKNKNFVINNLLFFGFFIVIFMIYPIGLKQNILNLLKIQKQEFHKEDYTRLSTKVFKKLHKNFQIIPQQFFSKDHVLKIFPDKDNLFNNEKSQLIFDLNYYIVAKEKINQDTFRLRKKNFQTVQNQEEFDQIFKCLFLSKEKKLLNSIKSQLWLLSQKKIQQPKKKVFFNSFTLSKNLYSFSDFLNKSKMNKNLNSKIIRTFSKKKIQKEKATISYRLLQAFLINNFNLSKKSSLSKKKIGYVKKTIEPSNTIPIISWKIKKYYLSFLINFSIFSNQTYNIVQQNSFLNKKNYIYQTKFNLFFQFFYFFSPTFLLSKKYSFYTKHLKLKETLIKGNNKLYLINQFDNENSKFDKPFFLLSPFNQNISRNKLLNQLLIKDITPIQKIFNFYKIIKINSYETRTKLLNTRSFYLIFVKKKLKKFILTIDKNLNYKKIKWKVYNQYLSKTSNLKLFYFSNKFIPNSFLLKIKLTKKNSILYKISNFEYITKSQNYLLKHINHTNLEQIQIFQKIEKSFNDQFLINLKFNEINDLFALNLLNAKQNTENYSSLVNQLFYFRTQLIKNKIVYNKRLLFDFTKPNIDTNRIYRQLLKSLPKYNITTISNFKENKEIFQKKITKVVQLKLMDVSVSKKTCENVDKIEFLSIPNFSKKDLKKLYFSADLQIKKIKEKKHLFENGNFEAILKSKSTPRLESKIIENYYNILYFEYLRKSEQKNNDIFQSIYKIFFYSNSKNFTLKNAKYNIIDKFQKTPGNLYIYNQHKIYDFFRKYISFKKHNYNLWFFTAEWWKYNTNLFVENVRKFFFIINYYIENFVDYYIKKIKNDLINFWEKRKKMYNHLNLQKNINFFINYQDIQLNSVWSDFELLNNFNLIILSLIIFIYFFYQNCFAILIGSDSIDLWKHFETINYLTDPSRSLYFAKLMHSNKTQLNKSENLLISFFSNFKYYVRNIRFFLVTEKNLRKLVINNKSVDLSRRKRNLLVQSLITNNKLKEYGFQPYVKQKKFNNEFNSEDNKEHGFLYFRYLIKVFNKDLINYPLYLADKWVFFASIQQVFSSQTLKQNKKFHSQFQKIPISLQFGLSCSKGILLIGPPETGRSYLIKNLTSDSSIPLLGVYINKLIYNKPDIITESWMNILIESLRRLNLILDLAKGMSPCIIWIRNIHQLDVNRSTENIESDPTFLLGILLKHFQTSFKNTQNKNNILIIGSTNIPKKVDPSLISPDRLDRIINIRLFNVSQRENFFPILLNKKNITLKKKLFYFDFGARTVGYNMRDLEALANEMSLISLTKNQLFIYNDVVRLAFHRQIFGFTHTKNQPNFQQNFKILLYKIGRAIIKNILVNSSPTIPLNISYYLWKRKFYYLSKWYYETSINESIVKESKIIIYLLGCLAGIAARDSWILVEENHYDSSIPLDKSVENDLDLAFSILESFSTEFPWFETCKTQNLNYSKQKKLQIFPAITKLSIMQNGIFSITNKNTFYNHNDLNYNKPKNLNRTNSKFKKTTWSPRYWQLSFSRSQLFDWIKRPNDFEFLQNLKFSRKLSTERKNSYNQHINNEKEQLLYERILPRVRKRNIQELELQFEEILLEEQFEILGSFCPSIQYEMQHQLSNKPRLFIGKRILWDPTSYFFKIRHFIFSRREFFVDEEMLRRLYITYGVRRERERSFSSHRIKEFFVYRGYSKDLINKLSIRWWNQFPIDQKQNIYTLKRIESIAIQLKRPQIFTPVYLYQSWLIENIPEKFSRLKFLTYQDRWIKLNQLLLNDSFVYATLLEIYQYLFEFFLSNKALLNEMIKILIKKQWLFDNEIREIIHNIKIK
uniref:Ycf2 n=1 Tax=Cololejeunea lanciloba TaxID=1186967 RepID=A0A4Y5P585_9MARC|nr:Ycf2 [Cololejeunea lanciloba]QCW58423.1 Ycf2 [Cololejeunea lanciloba]